MRKSVLDSWTNHAGGILRFIQRIRGLGTGSQVGHRTESPLNGVSVPSQRDESAVEETGFCATLPHSGSLVTASPRGTDIL